MSFLELEMKHLVETERSFDSFKAFYHEASRIKSVDFDGTEISKAILVRMHSWYTLQNNIKNLLNKRVIKAGSDFFVETMLLYLKTVFKIRNVGLEIHSERQIRRKRGSIRPDISVWDREEVKAIIECKTQLGYDRYGWKEAFEKREKKLKLEFPDAEAFLVVMTSENWPGFGEDMNVGKKYFALYNTWPVSIDLRGSLDSYINNRIEPLFMSIIELRE